MASDTVSKQKSIFQTIGPGLLFASSAIGTSHLVLSTRAGAHHGMIYFWIIIAALLLKYPFYEFGPRYALFYFSAASMLQYSSKFGSQNAKLFLDRYLSHQSKCLEKSFCRTVN